MIVLNPGLSRYAGLDYFLHLPKLFYINLNGTIFDCSVTKSMAEIQNKDEKTAVTSKLIRRRIDNLS